SHRVLLGSVTRASLPRATSRTLRQGWASTTTTSLAALHGHRSQTVSVTGLAIRRSSSDLHLFPPRELCLVPAVGQARQRPIPIIDHVLDVIIFEGVLASSLAKTETLFFAHLIQLCKRGTQFFM